MLCNRKIFFIIQYKSVFKNTEVKQKGLEKENMAEDILLALTAAENGVRVELDSRSEKLGYKMRESQTRKIPYTLILGNNERDERTNRCYK